MIRNLMFSLMLLFSLTMSAYSASDKTENSLSVKVANVHNENTLLVSFNEKTTSNSLGVLKIYDTKNNIVYQEDIELIKFPNYTAISLSQFQLGTYKVVLTTGTGADKKIFSTSFSHTSK